MGEPERFEAHAVLAPRRARLTRLALVLPLAALVAITWVGLNGAPADKSIADIPAPTATPAPTLPPVHPTQALGLAVHRLDEVQQWGLSHDEVVAITGWFVATAITDCPAVAVIYQRGLQQEVTGDVDKLAFCARSGVLYAAEPDPADARSESARLRTVPVKVVTRVSMPAELEVIGGTATEVVVIGRFVASGDDCRIPGSCSPDLFVDYVAWTPDS